MATCRHCEIKSACVVYIQLTEINFRAVLKEGKYNIVKNEILGSVAVRCRLHRPIEDKPKEEIKE